MSAKEQRERLYCETLELVERHGTIGAAARAAKVPSGTMHSRYRRACHWRDAQDPNYRPAPREVPMSEDPGRYRDDWIADDCVNELRRIAELYPDQVISRNFFRVHSQISESTWNRYFGTFQEFKRQAGITLSRHAHQMERNVAKHASRDRMRELVIDKQGWEGSYDKPSGRRFQTLLVGSDIHDRSCDPFWRYTFLDTAARVQPDTVVLNGDVFDLPEFSRYNQDPREWDVVGRIRWVHDFFRELRNLCPDMTIDLIEGNHEFRLLRHLAEADPAMRVILSDLHGWTIADVLGLREFEVNYIARMDLAAWTERDIREELRKNYKVYHDAVLAHHFPEGRHLGMPGWHGHHHKHVVWANHSPQYGSYEWHQLGCGHEQAADYCPGEKWSLGFLLAHVDTQRQHTAFEYIDLRDHTVIGGRWYTREAIVHPVSSVET